MKNTLKLWGIIAMVAAIGFSMAACEVEPDPSDNPGGATVPDGYGERPTDPPAVTAPKTYDITNDVATLGIIGTSARSSNDKIATAAVASGNITVTSVGRGVATIYVEGAADKSDAEIEVKVAQDGTITHGRIVKGGDDVIVISGTFGGVTVGGDPRPVRLNIKFDWDGSTVYLKPGVQTWSVKHLPFSEVQPLWFEAYIPITGDLDYLGEGTHFAYQYSILRQIKNSDVTDISIPAVNISDFITISGTASATLKGTWDRAVKYTSVQITNNSMSTNFYDYDYDPPLIYSSLQEGWTNAKTRVAGGQWSLKTPSSSESTNVSFSVQLESNQSSEDWNYLGYWEMGQKNNLSPTTISNQNKSGITLGTIPFVLVSGNTPVTVNGKRPFYYWIEFGYYWDENPTVEINGWAGSTRNLYDATGTGWAVPMPANTKQNASILYRETSDIQFRRGTDGITFNTGTAPVTLNLSSIAAISSGNSTIPVVPAYPVPDGYGEQPTDPPAVTSPKTLNITNSVLTLGVTGTSARSSNDKIATVAVASGNIVITSVGKGVATIYVEGAADKSDAEIEIKVATDGSISQGRIVKGGDDVIVISGTFGGVTIAGQARPVELRVHFDWDDMSVKLEPGAQTWSVKHLPFDDNTPLWFDAYIPTTGTLEYSEGTGISYQYDIIQTIRNSSITGISIPAVAIPSLVTISGTASATLKGNWDRDTKSKYTSVQVENKSITTDLYEDGSSVIKSSRTAGWTNAWAKVANGQWSLSVPSSSTTTNISFSVQVRSSQNSEEWNYLGYWEMGQKNNLSPTTISNQNKSGISLGTVPFVMVSGNTPVTVNGKRPFNYWIEFGYYWDENPTVEINGWAGRMGTLHETPTSNGWAVPMPENTKLNASILYRETSNIQFRRGTSGVTFNTGTAPVTLDLSSISDIYNYN